jgi:hypothetical protein
MLAHMGVRGIVKNRGTVLVAMLELAEFRKIMDDVPDEAEPLARLAGQAGTFEAVVASIRRYPSDAAVQMHAFALLEFLARPRAWRVNRLRAVRAGAGAPLPPVVRRLPPPGPAPRAACPQRM